MKLTARQTPCAVHLSSETGEERYLLKRRAFHRELLLSDLKNGRLFYVGEKEQQHLWNREGEVLCTLTNMEGKQELAACIRFEKEQLPAAPFRHGTLVLPLPNRTLYVKRTGEKTFCMEENGRRTGEVDCGSYTRPGQASGLEDGLVLAALFGWCLWFQQADCQITV